MKKIFTPLFVFALATTGFAQSLQIFSEGNNVTNSVIYDTISPGELTVHDLELHNVTANTVNYKVNRTVLNAPLPVDGYLYFCTGTQCYAPQSATTWTPGGAALTIAANSTLPSGPGTYGIAAHYDADPTAATVSVLYRVFNTSVAGDTSTVTIHYISATTAGVEESEKAGGSISAAYPNPASSVASIKYDLNQYANGGKIAFYDMLGKKVKEIVLEDKQGVAKVDVTEFKSGIYFYSFVVNDKVLATRKMVVSTK